jgi:hypothetical protein
MPPSPMGGGLGGGSPFGTIFTDLAVDLEPGWQMIDVGIRCFRYALKTQEFQKSSMGRVNVVIRELTNTAERLLSHYTSGGKSGAGTPAADSQITSSTDMRSADADAAPESE